MQVILFQSVDNLGSAGEVVNVKPGYFRNYLGPRGYAKTASKANMALMESRRKKIDAMVAREREAAKAAAGDLDGVELLFELRANDKGQLFGSVTTADIAKALGEKGYEVDRRKIELSEHIKAIGKFPVRVRLYPEVYAGVTVEVARYLRPEEIEAMEAAAQAAEEVAEQVAEAEADDAAPEAEAEAADTPEASPEAVEEVEPAKAD